MWPFGTAGVFDGKKTGRRAGPARQAGVFVRTHIIVPFVGVGVAHRGVKRARKARVMHIRPPRRVARRPTDA